eukprot:g31457.t1
MRWADKLTPVCPELNVGHVSRTISYDVMPHNLSRLKEILLVLFRMVKFWRCYLCGLMLHTLHCYAFARHLDITLPFWKGLLLKFWLHFSPMLLIYRHAIWGGTDKSKGLLVTQLLGLTKMAINRSRQWAAKGLIAPDCLLLFYGYICAWVSLERQHPALIGTIKTFRGRWQPWELECITGPDNTIFT